MIGSEVGWHGGTAMRRHACVSAVAPKWSFRAGGRSQNADLLSRWAFNQMLIGVATRKYARSIRLPDGDLVGQAIYFFLGGSTPDNGL
jgi:hypothetical protein